MARTLTEVDLQMRTLLKLRMKFLSKLSIQTLGKKRPNHPRLLHSHVCLGETKSTSMRPWVTHSTEVGVKRACTARDGNICT